MRVCDIADTAINTLKTERPEIAVDKVDVSDRISLENFLDSAIESMGGLDVLVNNAGIAGPTAGVEAIDPAEWDQTININLNSHFYCVRKAVPHLKKSSHAAIINLSSVAGRFGFAYRTPYAATKWAIVGFTESLAKELGPDGIRVNAIQPGVVEGARIDSVISARAEATGKSFEEMKSEILSNVSLRKMVSQQDIANIGVVSMLASGHEYFRSGNQCLRQC